MSMIYYLNSRNDKVDFIDDFHLIDMSDLFGSSFTAMTDNDAIVSYSRKITNFTLDGDGPVDRFDSIADVFDYDIYNNVKGRIYIGDYYMVCNISALDVSDARFKSRFFRASLTVSTDNPSWIMDNSFSFIPDQASEALAYPFSYPFVYGKSIGADTIINNAIKQSDFKLVIYGPAASPSLTIGDNLYGVKADIDEQEYVVIESKTRSVYKVTNAGHKESLFSRRITENDPFRKIDPGMNLVRWSGSFGFDLLLFEERSKPKWISSIRTVI